MPNFVQELQNKAVRVPTKIAIEYISDDIKQKVSITYAELDKRAKSIAAYLQSQQLYGERVLLLYTAGIDFVTALVGCFYAGVIAVPVHCPDTSEFAKAFPLLQAIADDADISGVLTVNTHSKQAQQLISDKKWVIDTTALIKKRRSKYSIPMINDNTIAFLQYTSGSTSTPKGVIITHKNIAHTVKITAEAWNYTATSVTLNWAPHSHVYGLVCGILVPLYHGTPAILMPTKAFIARPALWLEAISANNVTHSGCPNFGYDLCVREIDPATLKQVNLSSWQVAVNGGEAIKAETIKQFTEKFTDLGFTLKQFCPAYGMSEITGAITSKPHNREPALFALSVEGLKENNVIAAAGTVGQREFVSGGKLLKGLFAAIVDPNTCSKVAAGKVGEVWLAGKSVAAGYWRRDAESKQMFNLHLAGSKHHYFRTGDLGFIQDDELYLTGRLKELLIVNGKKYYPLDVESSVQEQLKKLARSYTSVVMTNTTLADEEIIFIQEVDTDLAQSQLDDIKQLIRKVVLEKYGIHLSNVMLVAKGALPKTASGKIQRKRCQQLYLDNKLTEISQNINSTINKLGFINECKNIIASVLAIEPTKLDIMAPLSQYSFDSINIIKLTNRLNSRFNLTLNPTILFEYSTLNAFFNDVIAKFDFANPAKVIADTTPEIQSNKKAHTDNDIAIIGMAGIFPGAKDLNEFWNNLLAGKNVITEIPAARWDWKANLASETAGTLTKWGGFINDVSAFDANFFNMSPREAELTDPQQRLFLQTAWNAIEDAGYTPHDLSNVKTGLFVGVFKNDYADIIRDANIADAYLATSVTQSILANRVSYLLNLSGPSEVIDTACSSSLVALHHAIQSIHLGDSDLAIAGGVNALLTPNSYISAGKAGMLSADGQCKTFDESANGYVRGEGVGVILLKKLSKAIADHDHIYAVIKGSAVNHGGNVSSLTVPNPNAQADVIVEACRRAHVSIDTINYIETHGTGTSLGDPIEINGLKKAFAILADEQNINPQLLENKCALGALKTHIGHLESAAGIASIIKVLLCLQHKTLPANRNFNRLNPYIDIAASPFHIVDKTKPWERVLSNDKKQLPLTAGISSFGFGGTNAHVILQEYIDEKPNTHQAATQPYLIPLSAKTDAALRLRVKDLHAWLSAAAPEVSIEHICTTLTFGRVHFNHRCAFIVNSSNELQQTLTALLNGLNPTNCIYLPEQERKLAKSATFTAALKQIQEQLATGEVDNYPQKLASLAEFYVHGCEIDWGCLHHGKQISRMSLPTYPFAQDHYWVANAKRKHASNISTTQTILSDSSSVFAIQELLKNDVAEILRISTDKIDISLSLNEMGFDSISYKELAAKLENHFDIELTPAIFFTHTNINTLSNYLQKSTQHQFVNAESNNKITTVQQHNSLESIAIVGMQAYLPQTDNLDDFWHKLISGHDFIAEVPIQRWNSQDYFGDHKANQAKTNSKWGAFISHFDEFDAGFFNISAREANFMDPQQRLFLEIAWKTFEDAGYNPLDFSASKTGVFVGVEFSEYQTLVAQHNLFHGYSATGNSHALLANRVSYFLNLHGPSESIDTACSSSLVAINRAVKALQYGECTSAIAGGVSLMVNPDTFVITSQLGVFSPDGHCKTFDKSANGYVKGEGVAALLLKPLRQAEQDGDHIYGIIRGTAVNHGGKAQSLTAPNAAAQAELLIEAYTRAGVAAETVTYIETHGTGTELGDPIEIEGLKLAFSRLTDNNKKAYCGLGALKTNIGHLEPASGIAGVIKVLLAMQHNMLPATLHQTELNPYIKLSESPFYVVNTTQTWNKLIDEAGNELPRRAGVSSFGFGGTNAHIILEEPDVKPATNQIQTKPYYLITLSAKQPDSLRQKVIDLCEWIIKHQDSISLADLSYSLNVGRTHFANRYAILANSLADLITTLADIIDNKKSENFLTSSIPQFDSATPLFNEIYKSTLQALTTTLTKNAYREKLLIVADLYTKYYPIDWNDLHANDTRKRVAGLPTYPFSRQRYWYDLETVAQPALANASVTKTVAIQNSSPDLYALCVNYLKNIFAHKLRLSPDQIDINETYEVYGVDSLLGLEITNRLEEDFGSLSKTLLYERNQIKLLATYFTNKHGNQLRELFAGQAPVLETIIDATEIKSLPVITPATQVSNDIAIVGLNGTFPQAETLDEFWDNLVNAKDCITEIPSDRWNYKDYPVVVGGKEKYYKLGGFINDVDKFDPLFFNISPKDAALMDPQERIFMQSAWATLEDAGYTRQRLQATVNNNVGVFVGVTYNFYPLFIADEWHKGNRIPLDIQLFSIANRFSYFLNFNGPSFIIDTACSSSLAAIHQACESIIHGECKMAIAGGVNLSLHPSKYHMLGSYSFMSDEGRCASFAEGGSGYVPSEGVGAVLLKPLADAIRDNDHIYGVIKASGMNHGGKTSGYTVPSPTAQADLIKSTLAKAQIDARTVSYIEAHGTGTALGDPIEIKGLQEAFEVYTQEKQFCSIGSVKSNIGHLESAAGISQLTKVLMQFRHKKLVPSIHSDTLNSFIDFSDTPFYVQRELSDWNPPQATPRRAGVSSFGAGGTNVHVIVEEYQPKLQQRSISGPYLFLLSALNTERLQEYIDKVYMFTESKAKELTSDMERDQWLYDACYTTQIGREAMTARLAILSSSFTDFIAKLSIARQHLQNADKIWFSASVQLGHAPENLSVMVSAANYENLATQWIAGVKIPWDQVPRLAQPKVVNLTTYPFAKRRCWIPTTIVEKPVAISTADIKWLIFSDIELGLLLQDPLNKAACCYVFPSAQYSQFNSHTYYINPESIHDIQLLMSHINVPSLQGIIYFWNAQAEKYLDVLGQGLAQHIGTPLHIVVRHPDVDSLDIHRHLNKHNVNIIELGSKINLRDDAAYVANKIINTKLHVAVIESLHIESIEEKENITRPYFNRESVLNLLLTTCARLLGLEEREIDPEIPFQHYGMDSIIGINFISELNTHYPDLLSPMDLYRYPSLVQLVNHIAEVSQPVTADVSEPEQVATELSEEELLNEIKDLSAEEVSQLIEAELLELNGII